MSDFEIIVGIVWSLTL